MYQTLRPPSVSEGGRFGLSKNPPLQKTAAPPPPFDEGGGSVSKNPQLCHSEERSDVGISCEMFRIRQNVTKFQNNSARLPRPFQGLAMTDLVLFDSLSADAEALHRRFILYNNYFSDSASSFSASLRLKLARPFSSKPMNLTHVISPMLSTSSTFSTRRFSSLEICTMPS